MERDYCDRCGGEMRLGPKAPRLVECAGCGRQMPPLANVTYLPLRKAREAVRDLKERKEVAA